MRKTYLLTVFSIFYVSLFAQLVNYEVEIIAIERTNYGDCNACGSPDPTWIIDLQDNASPALSNVGIHVPGNTTVFTNVSYTLANRINSGANSFSLALDAWEDNCNNDVFNFNSYNFFNCFPSVYGDSRRCSSSNVASVNFRTFSPCTWHSGVSSWCGDYRFTYRFRWSFNESPVIATQPSPSDNILCLGTALNLTASTTIDANGWPTGGNYQWQVSTFTDCASATASSWTNVGGANASSFTPPQTPGTRLYRVLITANCSSNFISNTVASNCVRVSYNPYGVPGDLPPDIQSGICGSIVLPGSTHPLSALLPPAVGAANGVTFAWTTSGGSFSQSSGAATNWTAPTTAGNYLITLTYEDACGQSDAISTCIVDVGSPNCDFAYVATTGVDDVFAGGPDNPYLTLSYAISQLAGRKNIRMAGGVYNENSIIQLENDLVIEGGYQFQAGIWTKTSSQNTDLVLSGFQNSLATGSSSIEHRVGILGNNDDGFTLQDLRITSTSVFGFTPDNRGRSNYAILLINGCENYNIIRCEVNSGNASAGSNGTTPGIGGGSLGGSGLGFGGSGANGNGNPGGGASGDSGDNASFNALIHPPYVNPAGSTGSGGSSGVGTDNCGGSSGGCPFSSNGCNGNSGNNGNSGSNGRSWQVNDRPIVVIPNAPYYVPGGQAGTGQDGGGGGQGAGGNGSRGGRVGCISCDGFNGGTGGIGGRGGRGGTGGYGSGGSFPIYTSNSNTGVNFSNILLNTPLTEVSGGNGANGSSGLNGGNGSGGNCNGCVNGSKCSGSGGQGGAGGNGGRGRDGANGVNAHLVVDGVSSNPSTSIPNFPIVSINYNNAKACIYSEISLSKDGSNSWNIPLPYVNDLSDSPAPLVTSSFSNGDNDVLVYSTTPGQVVNLQIGGATFNSYLRIADVQRALPSLTVSPANTTCINSSINLSATSWGTEVEYDWRIYQGTDVDNPSLSPSTIAAPTFDLNGLPSGLYTVRYKVREICCGWSIPIYDTIRIIDEPIVYQVQGGGGYCQGSSGAPVTLSGSQNGVSYTLVVNGQPIETVFGTGAPISFAAQPLPGNYAIIAQSSSNCISNMQGTVNVFIYPNPNDQDVLGDPFICSSGSITATSLVLDNSEIGINYQLILNDTIPLGVPIPGTGFGVSFGSQSLSGSYTVLATANASGCSRYLTDTVNVQLINGPTAFNVQGGGSFCAGSQGVNIDLSNSDIGVNYQLFWNYTVPVGAAQIGTGSSLSFGNYSLEGIYSVIAADNLGCENTMIDSLNVDELNPPSFETVLVNQLDCYGDSTASITINATSFNGGLSYVLNSDTNASGTFVDLPAGNYLLTIQDDSLCTDIYPVTPIVIVEPAELVIGLEAMNEVLCFGANQGAIGVNVNGGTPLYSYSWSSTNLGFSSSNEDISNLEGGTYYLDVTDQKGCTASDTFIVNAPSFDLSASITTTDVLCNGLNTGEATVNASGGTPSYEYLWHTNDTAQTIVNLNSGVISATITDANGCSTYVSDSINGPDAALTINLIKLFDVGCFGDNDGRIETAIIGGTPPYSVIWSPIGDTALTVSDLLAGIYTITVTDDNGCIATRAFQVSQPSELQIGIAPTQPGCPGEQTGLASVGVNGGVSPYSYVWNTAPNQFGIVATQLFGDQWYSVNVTDNNGCIKVDSVFIQNPDTIEVSVLPGNTSCISGNDGYAYIEVSGGFLPFSYELNGNYQTDSAFNNLSPGNYFVTVEDNQGCVANTEFTISPSTALDVLLLGSSLSDFNVLEELTVVPGEPIQLNAELINETTSSQVIEYLWYPAADVDVSVCAIDSLCENPNTSFTQNTQLVVEVIELVNGVGCSAFDTLDIKVRSDFPVFFPTAFSPYSDDFKIDCLNDYFELNVAGASNLNVKIFNRWGEMVFENPNQTNGPSNPKILDCSNPRNAWDGTFKGEPVPMGAYIYQVVATMFNGEEKSYSGSVTILR